MEIKNSTAAEYFFPNPSLEHVYYEAIANSIDANASEINIDIKIDSFSKQDTLFISILDNGDGFTDKNFDKFCHVLETDDKQHQGVGRFVYLNYFKKIKIDSFYSSGHREFIFDKDFINENNVTVNSTNMKSTKLEFSYYSKDKVKTYDYLIPSKLKESIILRFLPTLYKLKIEKKALRINISLETKEENKGQGFINSDVMIDVMQLPDLKEKQINDSEDFFEYFKLHYSIERIYTEQMVVTAICADGRSIKVDIISNKEFPFGYKMIFILYSDYFNGKTDSTRENVKLDEVSLRHVRTIFIKLISQVINEEIPSISEDNNKVKSIMRANYPHLQGYINDESVGLLDKNEILNNAQAKFFNAQKEVLEATDLTDEQYAKSLEYSSRVLTEYVLYRNKIIRKLKSMNANDNEAEIHNLIVPKNKRYQKNDDIADIFQNNAWILDDKYMTYNVVLSNKRIEEIYHELGVTGSNAYNKKKIDREDGQPDVTIIFSSDPETTKFVDVVIVEFKKLELGLAKKEEVISQLRQRARRLLEFYPGKIQRIWFYGIIDFDEEFISSIEEDDYIRLYSTGELYYKRQPINTTRKPIEKKHADMFLLSYNSMLEDAESRNKTFLQILKESIKKFSTTRSDTQNV
jgi:hypothetical protein